MIMVGATDIATTERILRGWAGMASLDAGERGVSLVPAPMPAALRATY
jgi:hypothetical protein